MRTPTIIEQTSECAVTAARAKWWRINTVKLSRARLSQFTGYSIQSINYFERGYDRSGRAIGDTAWRKYRMACAAVHFGFDKFDWRNEAVHQSPVADTLAESTDFSRANGSRSLRAKRAERITPT
jgi:hypothetical protein